MTDDRSVPPVLTEEQFLRQKRFSSEKFADELTRAFRKGVERAIRADIAHKDSSADLKTVNENRPEGSVAAAAS